MYCKHCGYELREGALICAKCGRPVSAEGWPDGYTPLSADDLRKEAPPQASPSQKEDSACEEAPEIRADTAEADIEEEAHAFSPPSEYPSSAPKDTVEPESLERDREYEHQVDRALTWGVIAVVFGSSMVLSPLGIPAAIISRRASKKLERKHGKLTGRARTGQILGLIGLIVGIMLSFFLASYVLILKEAIEMLNEPSWFPGLGGLGM